MSEVLIPFALNKYGEQVSIDEVENGLACECICISCKSEMVAKNQGELKQPHFAHLKAGKADLKCMITFENSVYWMSEDLITRSLGDLRLLTPALISNYDNHTPVAFEGFRELDVKSVFFFSKTNNHTWSFIIDVVTKNKRHPLAITLSFQRKLKTDVNFEYNGRQYSNLLIDLSGLYESWKTKKTGFKESLYYELLNNPANRFWGFHERSTVINKRLDDASKARLSKYDNSKISADSMFSSQERANLEKLANEYKTFKRI